MKKRYSIATISFLVAILAAAAIYIYEKPESLTLSTESGKSDKTDQLFLEMGMTRVAAAAVPFDVGLQDLNGRMVKLSEYKGKIVFLNFMTTWCQSCRDEMPVMEKLYNKLKNKDFAMVAVALEEQASEVEQFVQDFKLSFTVLLDSDGKAKTLFGVRTIPTTYILDKEGRIISSAAGPREWDSKDSFSLFEHLVKETVITTS
jgi:thiol-disulfide isomerase/thioredoxin